MPESSPHALKRRLIDAGRILEHAGHGDMTRGHVSVRLPDRPDHFLMKPHSVGFGEITMENILTIDLDGNVVAGTAKRHSEVFIHTEIFRARPDVHSVIHTHPTHTTAFAATGRPMRALSQGGAVFAGRLPVYAGTIDLIRTPEQGRGVAQALGQENAVLMLSHGLTMAAPSVEAAVILCLSLEEAARIQLLADAVGADVPDFPPEQVAALRENLLRPDQFQTNFDFLARSTRAQPGRH